MSKTCSIDRCDRKKYGRGWCAMHYQRWHKYGDPTVLRNYSNPEEAFSARAERRGDCLVWTGSLDRGGYGAIWARGKEVAAHRYAYERANGPIPSGMFVDHICHNRACVEAEHLRLATNAQNMQNRSGPTVANASGYRGVSLHQGRWKASVTHLGAQHVEYGFASPKAAAQAAQRMRAELFGEFAGNG